MNSIFLLPEQLKYILDALRNAGHEAHIVGGAVRDLIMNKVPDDYDVATSALPDDIMRIFSDFQIIPTGVKHGTVTVIADGLPVEITTFRTDGLYTDSRHPESVYFASSIFDDVKRRDFTINALAYNNNDGVIDSVGGINDIDNKLIRCVGEPDKRFREDALRMLRALRFASCLGFDIEDDTARAIKSNAGLLKNISAERIFCEFSKLLCGQNVKNILLDYSDVICVFLPEIRSTFGFLQHNCHHIYDVWQHTVICTHSIAPVVHLRLAALFHDIGKPDTFSLDENGTGHFYSHSEVSCTIAKSILQRLKVDSFTMQRVLSIIKYHDLQIQEDKALIKKHLRRLSPELFFDLVEMFIADNKAQNPLYSSRVRHYEALRSIANEIMCEEACFSLASLAVNGNDLIALGIPQGKAIGAILEELLDEVINEKLENDRDILLDRAQKLAK